MALSFAFDANAGETPQTVAQRRQMANLIAARMLGTAPKNVGEGLNAIGQAVIARSMMGEADDAQKAGMASLPDFLKSQITGIQPGPPSIAATPPIAQPMGNLPAMAPQPATTGKIYNNDEPSPLDPPSGADRQAMVATILGEAGNQGSVGQNAVASVIRNRAVNGSFGGDTPQGVVTAPNQFEPWNTTAGRSRMAMAAADPKQAAAADAAISQAYGEGGTAPNDPTNGATMFFSPTAQAALGRSVPSWAHGSGQDIGDHRFFGGVSQAPTQVAQADPAMDDRASTDTALPANSQPAQFVVPGAQATTQPQNRFLFRNASDEDLQRALINPFTPENVRTALTQEYKMRADAAQKAADPMRALEMQSKTLAVKKAQSELDKSDFEWKPVGRDANGTWQYGWVNSKTQEVRDRNGQPFQQNVQPANDPTAGLNGDDYLKAIPQDRADIARKVANGEVDVASLPNRGNYRMQVLSDAARFDPTFNPADYKTRLATRKDFTSGKSAQNITSFNTAIGHLDTLDKSIDPLGNRSSSWYNWATAPISEQTDPKYQVALKNFRTAKQAVADELARAFKGAGGTVHDISEWEKTINAADSPEALHAATKQAVELLHSRINAVGDQYNRGMGKTTDPVSLLSPKAQETLQRLEGGVSEPLPSNVQVDPAALAEARRRGLIK